MEASRLQAFNDPCITSRRSGAMAIARISGHVGPYARCVQILDKPYAEIGSAVDKLVLQQCPQRLFS